MSNLGWLGVAEAARLMAAKKLSPVDLLDALIARTEQFNPVFHPYIRFMPEYARARAKAAEAEMMAGKVRGPLHGIPVGLKDIIDLAGVPTTGHSKVCAERMAKTSAVVTERLEAAGAVVTGKLATHEFAIGGPSFDLPWPPAVNPWGGKHFPGGSSSGSGVALAAGLLPSALGTDTGGSVRNPASMCGIVGMKATYGRVSRRGVFPLAFSLDHVGPMTRDVMDNALLLNVLAGHDAGDPGSADVTADDYTAGLTDGVKGMKIGLVRHFYDGDETAHPEQIKAIDEAADVLRKLGAEVREIKFAPLAEYSVCNRVILASEAFAIHRRWLQERPGDYGALARERLVGGAAISAADYIDALRVKARLTALTFEAMAGLDAVLTASSFDPAPPIDDAEACAKVYPRQARQPFNVTGQPAMAMPAGFSNGGLPLSIQLVGHPWQEAKLYRVGYAYEQATQWGKRHPPTVA